MEIFMEQTKYIYKPKRFYIITFATTWFFWLFAILFNDGLTNTLGMVLGGIKAGERMAVVANADSTEAVQVINISTLLGDWVMEDPIDGSGEVGISIKDGGVAESINHTTIQYQSWRLLNGDLEITNTRDDGVDFEETYRYKLIYLGPDSLVFQETEKPVNETRAELFEYTRQKPKEHYDPGFELEDSKFEDFVF